MASLLLDTTVLFMTVMANMMPFVGGPIDCMLDNWHEFYELLKHRRRRIAFAAACCGFDRGRTPFPLPPKAPVRRVHSCSPVAFHYANVLFLGLVADSDAETWQSSTHLGVSPPPSAWSIDCLPWSWCCATCASTWPITSPTAPFLPFATRRVRSRRSHPSSSLPRVLEVLAGAALLLLATSGPQRSRPDAGDGAAKRKRQPGHRHRRSSP